MKTLTLRLDALAVQSFATGKAEGRMETAGAREFLATRPQICDPLTFVPAHCP